MRKKILIVEDEKDIIEMIEYNLNKEGYETIGVGSGDEALSVAKKRRPDLVLLDIMLPDIDGFDVCRHLKRNDITREIPIIMLTAKSQEADKVAGLELGADDYMTKPFSPRELIARIKAVLRRNRPDLVGEKNEIGIVRLDSIKHKVFIEEEEIVLTHTEFKILEFMMRRPGIVLSRDKLLDGVFGYDADVYDRTVDAHIKTLRKKMGTARDYIETVRGSGYRFKDI